MLQWLLKYFEYNMKMLFFIKGTIKEIMKERNKEIK